MYALVAMDYNCGQRQKKKCIIVYFGIPSKTVAHPQSIFISFHLGTLTKLRWSEHGQRSVSIVQGVRLMTGLKNMAATNRHWPRASRFIDQLRPFYEQTYLHKQLLTLLPCIGL